MSCFAFLFLSLIPEAASYMQAEWKQIYAMIGTGLFLGLGILFSAIIDSKIDQKISSNALYRLGIISVIALMLHNIPEGITTFISVITICHLESLYLSVLLFTIFQRASVLRFPFIMPPKIKRKPFS